MAQPQQGARIKLRHLNSNLRRPPTRPLKPNTNQLIIKNLEPLKQNIKKKVAQTLYYENHDVYESPLTRGDKGPVHQRLGAKQIRLKRFVPLGTNTSTVLPRKRTFGPAARNGMVTNNNYRLQNTPGQYRRHKLQRVYSAQARLERIRRSQINNAGAIKLRRPSRLIPPGTNLTVEVKNPNFLPMIDGAATFNHHVAKFKMILNPTIQSEIEEIQREYSGSSENTPLSIRVTPVCTSLPMTTRFALL